MLRLMARSDKKALGCLAGVLFMLLIEADEKEKEALKQADSEGNLSLERDDDDDEDSIELVNAIMYIIDTESPMEK